MTFRALSACWLIGVLGLTACAPSPEEIAAKSYSVAQTDIPAEIFSAACLQTLPTFNGFDAEVRRRGFTPQTQSSEGTLYVAPGEKLLTAGVVNIDGKTGCAVAFLGPEETASVGARILAETTRRTGGQPQEKLENAFFEYIYYLRNNSILSYDVRRKSGQIRHIFIVSPPVGRDEIPAYVFD